jgi:hypothetical protein
MKFLIQHNLINPEKLGEIKEAIKDYPHEFVGLIPFSHEITSNEPLEGDEFIPYGSTSMIEVALEHGWAGLHYNPVTANYRAFVENRRDMLNNVVMRLDQAIEFLETQNPGELWFTRPSKDLKEYTGFVDTAEELVRLFKDRMLCASSGSYQLSPDTEVVISYPKTIHAEYRWFIVGGKVITGSMYKNEGQLFTKEIVEQEIITETQKLADFWLPDPCCVMDLALTDFGVEVVEFNCINSSGFYACDVKKIFDALWDYHKER